VGKSLRGDAIYTREKATTSLGAHRNPIYKAS